VRGRLESLTYEIGRQLKHAESPADRDEDFERSRVGEQPRPAARSEIAEGALLLAQRVATQLFHADATAHLDGAENDTTRRPIPRRA
jgi:hypothetical protein